MQMVLPCASRYFLLCLLARIFLAPGLSLQSSSQKSVDIPDDQRVTTLANILSGVGVVRPAAEAAAAAADPAAAAAAQPAAAAAADSGDASNSQLSQQSQSPVGPRLWKIEAFFEMSTTAPVFTDEYDSNVAGFALTLADRLKWATDVPMSRFAFWLPDPAAATDPDNVIFCESRNNEHLVGAVTARYAVQENTTYKCEPQRHKINASVPVGLLQTAKKALLGPKKAPGLRFEVGIYPPSGEFGDSKPSVQIAQEIVQFANGGDEPERKLLKTGLWTYKPGPGVKFHGLFPATSVAMPGTAFAQPRDTSLPLGPNPGGHGAEPPVTPPPGAGEKAKEQADYFAHVDSVVHEATKINDAVKGSLQELKDSLARASAVHSAWMNTNVYQLPTDLTG